MRDPKWFRDLPKDENWNPGLKIPVESIWAGEVGKRIDGKDLEPEVIGKPLADTLFGISPTDYDKWSNRKFEIKGIDLANKTITIGEIEK